MRLRPFERLPCLTGSLAPAQKDIELELMEGEEDSAEQSSIGRTSFVVLALEIQQDQLYARREVKDMGPFPSTKTKIAHQRRKERILQKFEDLMSMADRLFPDLDMDAITYRSTPATAMDALSLQVPIPSAVCNPPPEMACLTDIELQLRVGEMNDALEGIREQLALKAYLFRHKIRPGKTKKPKTRAWTAIQRESRSLLLWKKKYDAARTTLIHLGAPTSIKDIYHPLKDEDLKTVTGVVNPNARGQSRETLAWFWFLRHPDGDEEDNEYLEEGVYSSVFCSVGFTGLPSVSGQLVAIKGQA